MKAKTPCPFDNTERQSYDKEYKKASINLVYASNIFSVSVILKMIKYFL